LRRIEFGKKAPHDARRHMLCLFTRETGACPCGGGGQHFSRAGETVARSSDTRAHFSISTQSAAQFLKYHRILVQDFAADRVRQKGPPRRSETRAERHWTSAPADHVAVSVVDRHAIPRAVGPRQRLSIGIVHITRRRIGRPFAGADHAADAARIRRGRAGGSRDYEGRGRD
jgi:hypothetical protein